MLEQPRQAAPGFLLAVVAPDATSDRHNQILMGRLPRWKRRRLWPAAGASPRRPPQVAPFVGLFSEHEAVIGKTITSADP